MNLSEWIDIVIILTSGISFIALLKAYLRDHSLLYLYFSLSMFSVLIAYLAPFVLNEPYNLLVFEWGRFIAITIVISALLVLIRNLKPVFARFPAYMTALPFISIAFFPLIADSLAIKELVNAIFQGGALTVCLLIFSINHFRGEQRTYYRIGMFILFLSYITYWFLSETFTVPVDTALIAEILFSLGIIFMSVGFTSDKSINQTE